MGHDFSFCQGCEDPRGCDSCGKLDELEEVKHGRWIIHFEHFTPYQRCSACGFELPLIATKEKDGDVQNFKRCPECGAWEDIAPIKLTFGKVDIFPNINPGESVTLDEIIRGGE